MPETNLDAEAAKKVLKEALKEWMDERYTELGKWSAKGIAILGFGALVWWILTSQGWHR